MKRTVLKKQNKNSLLHLVFQAASTNQAWYCFTPVIKREMVFSMWYSPRHYKLVFVGILFSPHKTKRKVECRKERETLCAAVWALLYFWCTFEYLCCAILAKPTNIPRCQLNFYVKGNICDTKLNRGQPELNRRPLDLQSNALPLSYTPVTDIWVELKLRFLYYAYTRR